MATSSFWISFLICKTGMVAMQHTRWSWGIHVGTGSTQHSIREHMYYFLLLSLTQDTGTGHGYFYIPILWKPIAFWVDSLHFSSFTEPRRVAAEKEPLQTDMCVCFHGVEFPGKINGSVFNQLQKPYQLLSSNPTPGFPIILKYDLTIKDTKI